MPQDYRLFLFTRAFCLSVMSFPGRRFHCVIICERLVIFSGSPLRRSIEIAIGASANAEPSSAFKSLAKSLGVMQPQSGHAAPAAVPCGLSPLDLFRFSGDGNFARPLAIP